MVRKPYRVRGNSRDLFRLRILRLSAGLKQHELAEALGVQASAVGKWERGENDPGIEMLAKIADFFGVTIGELFDDHRDVPDEWHDAIAYAEAHPREKRVILALVSELRTPEHSN